MTLHIKTLQRFLVQNAGLALDVNQAYLAESRLLPVAQSNGFPSVDMLLGQLQSGFNPALAQAAVEAMTTHETLFFRDRSLFDQIRAHILPKLMRARADSRRLRIWCAACSTGQEPYSLAILLEEEASKFDGWEVEIVATDVSHAAIAAARDGLYSQFEVQRGLPIQILLRYFSQEGDRWRLSAALRDRVSFRQHKLIRDCSGLGAFDLVLCRNVLIYFTAGMRRDVLARVSRQVAGSGYLALGASECIADAAPGMSQLVGKGFSGAIAMKPANAAGAKVLPFERARPKL